MDKGTNLVDQPQVPDKLQTEIHAEEDSEKNESHTIVNTQRTYKLPFVIVTLLFVLFCASSVYLFIQNNNLTNQRESLDAKLTSYDTDVVAAQNEAEKYQLEYDELVGEVNGYLREMGVICSGDKIDCLANYSKENVATGSSNLDMNEANTSTSSGKLDGN
ncbi:hypothetical protein IPM62_01955 [Candidatus Woesebacteria bacterium]|nr:MAG: hypothetical protein IPM62_01955 [Candidatus Woesebacteria bacterium]